MRFQTLVFFISRVDPFKSSLALRIDHNQAVAEDPGYPQKSNSPPVDLHRGATSRKPAS